MTRNEFIVNAFYHSQIWTKAKWVFSLFTLIKDANYETIPNEELEDYLISYSEKDQRYVYYLDDSWCVIEDSPKNDRPLYLVEETVFINNQNELIQPYDKFPFKTRAGNLFVNHYLLVYPFRDKIPYQNDQMEIGKLEKIIAPRIIDVNEEPQGDKNLYPEDVLKFSSACTSLAGFASINAPSATKYTMLPAPGIKEYRESLYKKYEGRLNDPIVISEIDRLLVAYDKAHQAKDPEGGFYISGKSFEVARKKLFVSYGLEAPEISGGKQLYIKSSLSEGWDENAFEMMVNALRDGSYNRGAMTALGGEAVKFIFRIFATTRTTEEDCGATLGLPKTLTKANIQQYIGNTIILKNKKQVTLTDENASRYIGEDVLVRSPALCRVGDANFCHKCMGEKLRSSKDSLAAMASSVGSQMLYVFMKKMHGTAMKSTKWHYKDTLG